MIALAKPGPRVLVVENDPELRELLRDSLEHASFDVVAVDTGREAMRTLEKLSLASWSLDAVDLVLTELYMPDVTGAELVALLRGARWPVPVVLMTENPSLGIRESTRAMGVSLLEKPFTLEEMKTTVRSELVRIRPV